MIPLYFYILPLIYQRLRNETHPKFTPSLRISFTLAPSIALYSNEPTSRLEFTKFQDFSAISHIFSLSCISVSSIVLYRPFRNIFFEVFFSVLMYILTPLFYISFFLLVLWLVALFTYFSSSNSNNRQKEAFSMCFYFVYHSVLCTFLHVCKTRFVMSFTTKQPTSDIQVHKHLKQAR